MYINIRIDTKYGNTSGFLAWVVENCNKYIYALEKIGTPDEHIHMVVEYNKSRRSIQRSIKSFGFSGNKSYFTEDVKLKDLDHKIGYAIKHGNLYTSAGFDLEYIDDLWDEYKNYEKSRQRAKRESVKVELFAYLDRVIRDDYEEASVIAAAVLHFHVENNLLIRRFQIISYVDTYMCIRNPLQINILASNLMKRE